MTTGTTQTPRTTCRSALFVCGLLALPSATAAQTAKNRDALYISAPFIGLADGLFDGDVTFAELKRHGDLGLGAITGSDGPTDAELREIEAALLG
jgi:hypothetical protein